MIHDNASKNNLNNIAISTNSEGFIPISILEDDDIERKPYEINMVNKNKRKTNMFEWLRRRKDK